MSTFNLWKRFQQYLCHVPSLGLTLDISRMRFEDGFLHRMAGPMQRAFEAMDALERGEIANPDENRMVGHYWLRAPDLAPSPAIAAEIRGSWPRSNSLPAPCTKAPSGRRTAGGSAMCYPLASVVRPSVRCLFPTPSVIRRATR